MCEIKWRPEDNVSVNYEKTEDTGSDMLKDQERVMKREILDAREVPGKTKERMG